MKKKECGNPKVISFFAILGSIVSFVVSIIATIQDIKIVAGIFFIAAFYCLSKINFKDKESYLHNRMTDDVEYGNPKVISFFAILGVIVNFAVSIIAITQDRKTTSLLYFIAALYCLLKINFKGKKSHLSNMKCIKSGIPEIIMLLLLLVL